MTKPRKKKNESIDAYNERASKLYYDNGYHIKEIAERLKIDETEVYNYVVTNGRKITTAAEREEMIQLFNKGYSYYAIANIFQKSRSCVKKRIECPAKIGYSTSNDLTDKQLKKMKEMAENGETLEAISKEIGVKVGTIRYRLDHTNMRERTTHVTPDEVKKFIRLYKKGKSHAEIAKICNRSRGAVCRHLHRAGYWRSREE